MSSIASQSEFNVNILVQAAGPVRPRTKYKKHKLLRANEALHYLLCRIPDSISHSRNQNTWPAVDIVFASPCR